MTNSIDFTGKVVNGKVAKTKAGKDFSVLTLENGDGVKLEIAAFGFNHNKVASAKNGDIVHVLGSIANRQYTDKNGVDRFSITVNINDIEVKPPSKEKPVTATTSGSEAFNDIPF